MYNYSERWPELKGFIKEIWEFFTKSHRPANEVILDDLELQAMLHISKRTSATLREQRLIPYHKSGGKIYYLLSDVLDYIKRNRVEAITENLKAEEDGK